MGGKGSGGFTKGRRAARDSSTVTLLPSNPMNQMGLMTVDQMAEIINNVDPENVIQKINYFNLAVLAISKTSDNRDVDSMWGAFEALVSLCSATGLPISNKTAYTALGITDNVAINWANDGKGSTPEKKKLIQHVRQVCATNREMMAAMGKLNPVLTIFWQKNYDGLKDQQEHVVNTGDPLGERQSAEQIAEKYEGVINLDE